MLTLIGEIKKLPVRKANRIVIAELMEMPGCAETLIVSDTEEDFVPVKWAMTDSTVKRPVSEAISCASCAFRGFPIRVPLPSTHRQLYTAHNLWSIIFHAFQVPKGTRSSTSQLNAGTTKPCSDGMNYTSSATSEEVGGEIDLKRSLRF